MRTNNEKLTFSVYKEWYKKIFLLIEYVRRVTHFSYFNVLCPFVSIFVLHRIWLKNVSVYLQRFKYILWI